MGNGGGLEIERASLPRRSDFPYPFYLTPYPFFMITHTHRPLRVVLYEGSGSIPLPSEGRAKIMTALLDFDLPGAAASHPTL